MAFEKVLRPWCSSRTLFRGRAWWLLDKPAGVRPDAGLVGRAGAELFRVAWSPPERASGVAVLGLPEAAPLAEPAFCAVVLVYDGKGSRAWGGALATSLGSLELQSLQRNGRLQLGRVRVPSGFGVARLLQTLSEQHWPVVGGSSSLVATRLWLHVEELHLPKVLAPSCRAPLPGEFARLMAPPKPACATQLETVLREQGIARWALLRERDVIRLGGEPSGELHGATVDAYGDSALLAVSSAEVADQVDAMADCLMDWGAARVYVKHRVRGDLRSQSTLDLAPPEPVRGEAIEDRFLRLGAPGRMRTWLHRGHSTGVFVDQSRNWTRVRSSARGRSVLNLFCYSGAFTLAAALGGAKQTLSVDLSASALRLLRDNLAHNELSGPRHRLHKDDVTSWLRRAVRRGDCFDMIVVDPPSFGSRKRGVFRLESELRELLGLAAHLLAPGGSLLTVGHHRALTTDDVQEMVLAATEQAGISGTAQALCADWDCPTLAGASTTYAVWFDGTTDGTRGRARQ